MAFRNLRISMKLLIGFGFILVVAALIVIISIRNLRLVNEDTLRMYSYPVHRYNILNSMSGDLTDIRRIGSVMSFRLGEYAALAALRSEATQAHTAINNALREYQTNIQADAQVNPAATQARINESNALQVLINRYINEVVNGIYATARAARPGIGGSTRDRTQIEYYFALSDYIHAQMVVIYNGLMLAARDVVDTHSQELVQRGNTVRTVATAASVTGIILAMALAFYISNSITKPLNKVVKTLQDVADGNLNSNIDTKNISRDETGVLTKDAVVMVSVVRGIMDDLNLLYKNFIETGNIDYTIDASKYKNSYRDIISLVNKLVTQVKTDLKDMASAIEQVGDGDFKVTLDEAAWAGDWIFMPKALNKLSANLNAVGSEVNAMIDAVANKGNLDFNIDAANYRGDWRSIMQGLNDITVAMNAPIQVVSIALEALTEGNFDLETIDNKIKTAGYNPNAIAYQGTFKAMITSFDTAMDSLASYLLEIEEVLAKISGGDLRVTITRPYVGAYDDIKQSVNNISTTLNKTMNEIQSASDQVLAGAHQISTSANNLASGAQEQASSVEELNATIDIINQQTQQNADSADAANNLSGQSATKAREGNEAMQSMVKAMGQIKESSNSISKIVQTIQDIAFQTNLLALNASVEAARAGEHGRGFSVVADEVRTLAGRSQKAVAETTGLIQDSITRVESGVEIAQTTAESLDIIVSGADEVLSVISSISASSKEQAEAIVDIGNGLAQISTIVQSNSAVSEETAAASQELNSQAETLRQLVSFFKI